MNTPLGFKNLLGQLTQFQKIIILLIYYKGYNWETAKWKRYVAKLLCGGGGGVGVGRTSTASQDTPPFQYTDVFPNREALQILSFRSFYEGLNM